jgi:hypothetical protein
VILFVSVKDSNRLYNFANVLEGIYPNMEAVIMMSAKEVICGDNYVEAFVFKKHDSRD